MGIGKSITNKINQTLKRSRNSSRSSVIIVAVVLVVLMFYLALSSEVFLSYGNLFNLFRSTSIYGVIAIGMTFVILTGGIDLSVGSVVGLTSILTTMMIKNGMPLFLSIVIAMAAAVTVGILNGIIIHFGKVPPFIATLGSMTVVRGMIKLISDAKMITGLPKEFSDFALKASLGLPNLFWIWLLVILVSWFILTRTIYGRNVYAIGSNEESARLSGISISRNIVYVYATSAFLSGLAGIMLASRLASGIPTAGSGYELDAIAATVVGGTALTGAKGGVLGTFLGSILLATIRNGGVLLGINPFILEVIIGLLIVVAVIAQRGSK
ncbi:MAG: ABC transporter permease [Spirochaetales bacterium]|nr:ABC transporter permease [Spirochaetales bacterium]